MIKRRRSRSSRSRSRDHWVKLSRSKRKNSHHDSSRRRDRSRRRKYTYSDSSSSYSSSSDSSSQSYSSSVSSSTRRRRNTSHFKFQIGQKIGHKYRLERLLGTGTFGRVIEARHKDRYYAIKIIKPVQKYIESAKTERNIIKELNEKDVDDKYHLVRYFESFYHHKYYCLVFEPLGLSLYDIIKKNQYQGFPLNLLQSFFRQILKAVGFMHKVKYTHTDLKPENILMEHPQLYKKKHASVEKYYLPVEDKVKLIDFGGATHASQRHSSIINTRQYRSPQVILKCCNWNEVSDVWSIGCIIPQLYTGDLYFQTHDDVEHLLLIQKSSGKIPSWMARQCRNDLTKMFKNGKIDQKYVEKNFSHWQKIAGFKKIDQIFDGNPQLIDLLQRCLQPDPRVRLSCEQALQHRFFTLNYEDTDTRSSYK